MINVRLATVCPLLPSVLPVASLLFSLSLFPLSAVLSYHRLSHFQPFSITLILSLPLSFRPLPRTGYSLRSLHVHPCKARTHKYSHAHTPLCLYLIIGSITGDIFPDNASEGGEPCRPNERGRSLYPSSHGSHSTGTPTD